MKLANFFVRIPVCSLTVQTVRLIRKLCSSSIFIQFHRFRSTVSLSAIVLVFPCVSYAQVLFSEIAWMGTAENFRCEWIELQNSGSADVDVSAWRLQIGDGQERVLSPDAPLSISSGGYLIIERLVPSCPDPVANIAGTMLAFGDIPNSDTSLTLLSPEGEEDRIESGTDWAGKGDNTTKETAQRSGNAWITAAATPGTAAGSDTVSSITDTPSPAHVSSASRASGSSRAKTQSKATSTTLAYKDTVLELTLNAPVVAYVNQPVRFEVVPTGAGKTTRNSLHYHWNFGDLNTAETKDPQHAFAYEGEYIVVVEAEFGTRKAIMRHEIDVLPVTVSLSKTPSGDVVVRNNASHEIDLSGYVMSGETSFIFPKNTVIKARGSVTVPLSRIGKSHAVTLSDSAMVSVAEIGTPTTLTRAQGARAQSREPIVRTSAPAGDPALMLSDEPSMSGSAPVVIDLDASLPEIVPKTERKTRGFFASVRSLAARVFGVGAEDEV